jgi:hypothetical protein
VPFHPGTPWNAGEYAAGDFVPQRRLRAAADVLHEQIVEFSQDEGREQPRRRRFSQRGGALTVMALAFIEGCEQAARVEQDHDPPNPSRHILQASTLFPKAFFFFGASINQKEIPPMIAASGS